MLIHYVKIALRNLRTQWAYTVLNIVGLSVGIAGSLLIFLFVQYHLRTDRHHSKFDRIYRVVLDMHLDDGSVEHYPEAPLPMAQVLRTHYPQVEQAAFLIQNRSLTVSIPPTRQEPAKRFLEHDGTILTEPQLFQIFDYQWLSGKPGTALTAPNSVVLTRSWAIRYFGTPNVLGRTLVLDNKVTATVTGLLADPIQPTDSPYGLFISMATLRQLDPDFNQTTWGQLNSNYRLYCTLKANAAPAPVEATFPGLVRKQFGSVANVFHFQLQPLADVHFDVDRVGGVIQRSILWSLRWIGLFLILTACINFINLATAQAGRRSKDVGVRKALGSTRAQLARQYLLETGFIVGLAVWLAILIAWPSLPLFNNWIHGQLTFQPLGTLLLFVALLGLAVVVLAGGYPAFILSGFSANQVFRRAGLKTTSAGKFSMRQSLVVIQFVVCQALLVSALVVMKQMSFIRQTDLGFRKGNVVIVGMPFSEPKSWQAFKNELQRYQDIQAVTLQYRPPSANVMNGGSFKFGSKEDWAPFPVRERLADADYLNTYQLQLVAGRNITASDSIREYVINETLLHKLGFQDPNAILGKRMQYYLSPVPLPIVGVVKDFHQKSLRESIAPCFIATYPAMYRQVGIRIRNGSPRQTLAYIREVWQRFFPNEVFEYEFLDDQVAHFYEMEASISRLVNTFALMAVFICALGLYGLVSLSITQRTKEIGIRKVLGASTPAIVRLFLQEFIPILLLANAIAWPIAYYFLTDWLSRFAYRPAWSWLPFAVVAGVLALLTGVIVSTQTIRAALVNPVKSLRSE